MPLLLFSHGEMFRDLNDPSNLFDSEIRLDRWVQVLKQNISGFYVDSEKRISVY